jgi:hypothetical protein
MLPSRSLAHEVFLPRGTRRETRDLQNRTFHHLHTMAPPNGAQISPNEGNTLLAILAFQSGQCASISASARIYNVSKAALTRRINGGTTRECHTPADKKLTNIEEEVLVRNILKLDTKGLTYCLSCKRSNVRHNL